MTYQEKCLTSRIESLRNQLNQNAVLYNNHFKICEKTYALSIELDKLICQYMKVFKKSV
ncbi:MAG: aspartyl-phosphate phosphatase Spo0E family protein [Firmicutes bacterium]|nr:aspartyl-phosphate phosphatase Spo0E family protein [Bacillota bacterium]